jgi:hypothetical protein
LVCGAGCGVARAGLMLLSHGFTVLSRMAPQPGAGLARGVTRLKHRGHGQETAIR